MSDARSRDPEITVKGVIALIWVETAIALVFVGIRFYFRLRHKDHFTSDDAFVALGAASMVVMSALYTPIMPAIYLLSEVINGKRMPPPDFVAIERPFLRHQFAIIVLFWIILWSVKGAFMMFYKQMFGRQYMGWQTWAWWVVAAICIITFVANFILQFFACMPLWTYFTIGACSSPEDVIRSNASLYLQTATDIFCDLLIAILPLSILWNLKKGLKTRLALGVLFSSGGVIILFALLRLIFTVPGNKQVNPKWLAIMSSTEALVALIVSCAPPFRKYFAVRAKSPSTSKNSSSGRSGARLQSDSEKGASSAVAEPSSAIGVEQGATDDDFDDVLGTVGSKRGSKQLAAQKDF